MMTDLLLRRAQEIAPGIPESETTLLIAAHGTDLNENSAVAAKREAEKIRALGRYAAVLNVYMEEPPLVSDWKKLTKTRNVVVVPFFISDGLHSYEDIPRLLGIVHGHLERSEPKSKDPAAESSDNFRGSLDSAQGDVKMTMRSVFRRNPYAIENRSLFYAPSIGTDSGFADLIVDQTNLAAKG